MSPYPPPAEEAGGSRRLHLLLSTGRLITFPTKICRESRILDPPNSEKVKKTPVPGVCRASNLAKKKKKKALILSRLGELLNTQKNVHFLSPGGSGGPGGPPGGSRGPKSLVAQSLRKFEFPAIFAIWGHFLDFGGSRKPVTKER